MTELTDRQLNEALHEASGFGCVHVFTEALKAQPAWVWDTKCDKCGKSSLDCRRDKVPDYCNDPSWWVKGGEMARLIEEKGMVWDVVNRLGKLVPHHASLAWQYLTVSARLRTIATLEALEQEKVLKSESEPVGLAGDSR